MFDGCLPWGDGDGITSSDGRDCEEVARREDFRLSKLYLDDEYPQTSSLIAGRSRNITLNLINMSYFNEIFTLEMALGNSTNFTEFNVETGLITLEPLEEDIGNYTMNITLSYREILQFTKQMSVEVELAEETEIVRSVEIQCPEDMATVCQL